MLRFSTMGILMKLISSLVVVRLNLPRLWFSSYVSLTTLMLLSLLLERIVRFQHQDLNVCIPALALYKKHPEENIIKPKTLNSVTNAIFPTIIDTYEKWQEHLICIRGFW